MTPYRIQYVGNLFVDRLFDHFSKFVVPNKARTLALLGNIGCPSSSRTAEFLDYCGRHWATVLWIPGPYELGSHGTFHDNLDHMHDLCRKKNIRMLHQNHYTDGDIRILGTTLWTPCSQGRVAEKYSQIEFSSILKTRTASLTPFDIAEMNQEDVEWIRKELLSTRDPTVVLTHHLPHPSLFSTNTSLQTLKRVGLEVNHLAHLFEPPLHLWLAGSSGSSAITRFRSGTTIAVNSMYEYPMRSRHVKNPGFNSTEVAELGSSETFPFHATIFYGPRFPFPFYSHSDSDSDSETLK